ncbi:MAG TPA: NB-ARC domain-containing protein [Chloroflexota bacterium]|nr:NB-ARC domain-containing protein [Chloroflexota bacterium]
MQRRKDYALPDLSVCHGRLSELETLSRWLLTERCRLVAVLGIGGIGKTTLVARLAHDLAPRFEAAFWRSVRNAPPVEEWLAGALAALSAAQTHLPDGEEARLTLLLDVLRQKRCLLILDSLETILQPGAGEGRYRDGYTGYSLLLRRVAETGHQSCLLVISRETPPEMGPPDGARFPGRPFPLTGLGIVDGLALLRDTGLRVEGTEGRALVERYGGNPLALKVVAATIAGAFDGNISAFLDHGTTVFGDIRQLLDDQVDRISPVERDLCYWLAVAREPVSFGELIADLGPGTWLRGAMQDALEALRRRSLLVHGQRSATFTLQPMVLEYMTIRLVKDVSREILERRPALLRTHALVKGETKDYVGQSQERLIATPLLAQLTAVLGDAGSVEQHLLDLLQAWRGRTAAEQGYGPGNVVNLLRLLRGDLQGIDLSRLVIRHPNTQQTEAQDSPDRPRRGRRRP